MEAGHGCRECAIRFRSRGLCAEKERGGEVEIIGDLTGWGRILAKLGLLSIWFMFFILA
jgi:hypothetical protein